MRRAVLICNPTSGRHRAAAVLAGVVEILEAGGFVVEQRLTGGPGDATGLAAEAAAREEIEVVFGMGGDGTLREVACGLLGTDVALGPLPVGTTNVLTLALGLPRQALAAARVLPRCETRAIDVGLVAGRPFLMQVSSGLDSAVMATQSAVAKKHFGQAAVAWNIMQQWLLYGYPELELRVDGRRERVSHFAACNIPYYAGPFRIAPDAHFDDGRLDLVLFRGRGRFATLGFLRDLALERHVRRGDVEIRPVTEVELVGPRDVVLQLDGDVLAGRAPITITVAADKLRVLGWPS